MSALHTLYLEIGENNDFGEEEAKRIGEGISKLSALLTLYLIISDYNNIDEEGAKSIG